MKSLLTTVSILLIANLAIAQNYPKGLATGENAPDFYAQDQYHKKIELHAALKKGPVVLLFYRGQWCPYCNKELARLQDSLSLITSKGATVLAITPERPENVTKTIDKTKASFSILHDEGLRIMKQYEVAYAVDDATISKYIKYGIDLDQANGSNGSNLPVPAVYIISSAGKVIYKYFDVDITKRASVKEILEHL